MTTTPIPASPRVLSVQSHVVSGYCGNKSATFPLQLLEFEVDIINSVQLSNHTQYKVTKGQIFDSKDLVEIHAGLKANNLFRLYDYILTGYVADISYIEAMACLIKEIKEDRKMRGLECCYTLDPVLGDDGVGYYVPNGFNVGGAYKRCLLPLADIVTPNRFEASILSGIEIDPESDHALKQALRAIKVFHQDMGVNIVAITSLEIAADKGKLICILSQRESGKIWSIRVPKLACPFTGTGDLFTALLVAWLHKTKFDLKISLEKTANTLHEVLEDTLAYYHQIGDESVQSHELRLVQNKDKIMSPKSRFIAEPLDAIDSLSTNGDTK